MGEQQMTKETMTAMERMEAAVRLEPIDRVPCAPLMDIFFPTRWKGKTIAEGLSDVREAFHHIGEVFDAVGGWDGMLLPGYSLPTTPHVYSGVGAGRTLQPGKDLPEDSIPQFDEKVALTHKEYDLIIEHGWHGAREIWKPMVNPFPDEKVIAWTKRQMGHYKYELEYWRERGVRSLCGAITASPLHIISTARTLMEVTKDIYYHPDKVEAVFEAMLDDLISDAIEAASISGEPGVMLVMERGSAFYYPLEIYERFEFPHMKKMIEAFHDAGLITVTHLDTNYTKNLPYFKNLPAKSVVVELDSASDIFEAKEILKGHCCIAGDVPAALNSLGTPEEVEDYCKKLIDVVGKDGGFILSTGCTCPADCKFDNFKAMVDTTMNYWPH
jgi:uroporphyrinogen-III decarboxylase